MKEPRQPAANSEIAAKTPKRDAMIDALIML
jgi:hypothetical protein